MKNVKVRFNHILRKTKYNIKSITIKLISMQYAYALVIHIGTIVL